MHHCEGLVKTIKTDISFAIFGVPDEKILISQQNLQKKDLEDTRRHHEAGHHVGPLGQTDRSHMETDRSATEAVSPPPSGTFFHRLLGCISTVPEVGLIQRWAINVTRIDDMAIPCPLLHLGLYKQPQTPLSRHLHLHYSSPHQKLGFQLEVEVPLDESLLVHLELDLVLVLQVLVLPVLVLVV